MRLLVLKQPCLLLGAGPGDDLTCLVATEAKRLGLRFGGCRARDGKRLARTLRDGAAGIVKTQQYLAGWITALLERFDLGFAGGFEVVAVPGCATARLVGDGALGRFLRMRRGTRRRGRCERDDRSGHQEDGCPSGNETGNEAG